MPISSDKLNGYPTERDPHPKGLSRGKIFGYNGYPRAKKKALAEPVSEDAIPAEQIRLVETAVRNTEKMIRKRRIIRFLEIFGVPHPTTIPGQKGLYSRWLKEKGDERFRFPDIDAMCRHLMENYSDDEKDAKWHEFVEETEVEVDAAEDEAKEMYGRVQETTTPTPGRILDTKELPVGELFNPDSFVPDPH